MRPMPLQLKRNLTSQLQISRSRYGSIPITKTRALNVGYEVIQKRMRIEHIEGFPADLDIPALRDPEILGDPEIQVCKAKTAEI